MPNHSKTRVNYVVRKVDKIDMFTNTTEDKNIPGRHSNSPEIPMALGMTLAHDSAALNSFSNLTETDKIKAIEYISSSTDPEDELARTDEIIQALKF